MNKINLEELNKVNKDLKFSVEMIDNKYKLFVQIVEQSSKKYELCFDYDIQDTASGIQNIIEMVYCDIEIGEELYFATEAILHILRTVNNLTKSKDGKDLEVHERNFLIELFNIVM